MLSFYKNLSEYEKKTVRTLARYSALMFAVPLAIAITMPSLVSYFGIRSPISIFITAGSATVSVLVVAIIFAYRAYQEHETSAGESQAKIIMSKPIKGE